MSTGDSEKITLARMLMEWIKGQPFNNVLVILLIAVIAWAVYDAQHNVIPAERQAIQSMVEKVEQTQAKEIDRICESFDKALDRATMRPVASLPTE